MSDEATDSVVAELSGLYGTFTFSERLLQKLWAAQAFDPARLRTTDGRRVRIQTPGTWNLLGGPDFREAQVFLDDQPVRGDVEVHLRAEDWVHHGHARDRAYDGVVLHVLLFEPEGRGPAVVDHRGRPLPTLVLLPALHHSLEEYAADEALETLAERDLLSVARPLLELAPEERGRRLGEEAGRRWEQKVRFATVRIDKLGWEEAAHHTALEILGYRFNRVPMLGVAARWPLTAWRNSPPDFAETLERGLVWKTQAVRPANHPRARLKHYAAWTQARPEWPQALTRWGEKEKGASVELGPDLGLAAARMRRELGLTERRESLATDVVGGALNGSRLDTLACDGFLPLLAARAPASERPPLFAAWFAWFAGDGPEELRQILRLSGVAGMPGQPYCHGLAQGLLHRLQTLAAR